MRIVAGRWGGRLLVAPPGRATRPTSDRVREAWMNALLPWLPGARVVDLFAGSGALGLEALSRGAAAATFVERANGALRVLQRNIDTLGAGDVSEVVRTEAMAWVRRLPPAAYDVALADPPYGEGLAAALVEHFAATPFAGWLWVEHRATEVLPDLPGSRTRRYGDTAVTSFPAPDEGA